MTCQENADALASKHGVAITDPPLVALNIIFAQATYGLELTSHYFVCSQPFPASEENGERIKSIGQTVFVRSISAIEYSINMASRTNAEILQLKKKAKNLYLGELIAPSISTVNPAHTPCWTGLKPWRKPDDD